MRDYIYFPDPALPPYLRRLDPAERNGPRAAAGRVRRPLGQTWARHGDRHKHTVVRTADTGAERRVICRVVGVPRLDLSKQSFRYRSAEMYNNVPRELTNYDSVNIFKTAVKSWIIHNIPARPYLSMIIPPFMSRCSFMK